MQCPFGPFNYPKPKTRRDILDGEVQTSHYPALVQGQGAQGRDDIIEYEWYMLGPAPTH